MDVCGGRITGIAKGAGMIEPDMATMLSYILTGTDRSRVSSLRTHARTHSLNTDTALSLSLCPTDLSVPRDVLRQLLAEVVGDTFNAMSIDTDQSTSDTVSIVSSDQIPFDLADLPAFKRALEDVCQGLCEDIVRNGEGAHHVMRVVVRGAESVAMAKGVGKSVVNSPLLKCAVAGNDPNVGRLVMAIGKYMGKHHQSADISRRMKIRVGGITIFENGEFVLNSDIEQQLVDHMRQAQLTGACRGHWTVDCPILTIDSGVNG